MRSKILNERPERTHALVFDTGDEPIALLARFAEEHRVAAARFTAIGAFSELVLGYFDWEKKDYQRIALDEQVEVLALTGDVSLYQDRPKIHAHVVVGRRDGGARGGHLLSARVRPTLEVLLIESPAHLVRQYDPASGIPLIRL